MVPKGLTLVRKISSATRIEMIWDDSKLITGSLFGGP